MHDGMACHGMYESVCLHEKHGLYACVMMKFYV